MIVCIDFHGIPLTFDCDVEVEPEEKPTNDSPGYPAEATVTTIRFEGEEIDPDDDVWEAIGIAATGIVRYPPVDE